MKNGLTYKPQLEIYRTQGWCSHRPTGDANTTLALQSHRPAQLLFVLVKNRKKKNNLKGILYQNYTADLYQIKTAVDKQLLSHTSRTPQGVRGLKPDAAGLAFLGRNRSHLARGAWIETPFE